MVLHLRGSQALTFSPMGKDTQLELRSNWPDPSFQGGWLPVHYEVLKRVPGQLDHPLPQSQPGAAMGSESRPCWRRSTRYPTA